jgi:signal transduction histidine kinase
MNNLVSNAVKYNRDQGRVDVTVETENDSVFISVSDTGIGISEEEREKLFEDFSRIKNKKTKNILGSGLGLSIVKKLVNLYNGSIDVQSKPDEGSTFSITLENREPAPENKKQT